MRAKERPAATWEAAEVVAGAMVLEDAVPAGAEEVALATTEVTAVEAKAQVGVEMVAVVGSAPAAKAAAVGTVKAVREMVVMVVVERAPAVLALAVVAGAVLVKVAV